MAAVIVVSVIAVLGFTLGCLALWQVRPARLKMGASVGRWVSFTLEMDRTTRSRRLSTQGFRLHEG